ncbi:TVP38/TMEM64 family protein [Brevibacillus migulae]|uniref:TVP38/TMEM64 family protein n=1 Tax=Brevibacillus migulae TaxID=1644114 RepID=UPI00106E9541|nr:VTT domain-containing protein [Brevibacillus migulae]
MPKWWLLILYAAVSIAAVIYKEPLLHWLEQGETRDIPLMIGAASLFALFPVLPYGVLGGVMGAKYGALTGGIINVTGSTVAAVIMFFLVRYVFAERGRAYVARVKRLEQFTVLMERHPFFAILFARLIPILPAAAVNIYAGISRIRPVIYIVATIVGKFPVMVAMAIAGEQLFSEQGNVLGLAVGYTVFLAAVYLLYRWWRRR